MNRTRLWMRGFLFIGLCALICGTPLATYCLAVTCNCQEPRNQMENCGVQSNPLCEGEHDGGFNCLNNTKWYYEGKGVVNCDDATENDLCRDSSLIQIKCACKYRCSNPNPATGFCAQGAAIMVLNEETGQMEHQCSYAWKKIAGSCTVPEDCP